MKTILITGIRGFIGQNMAQYILEQDLPYNVIGIDSALVTEDPKCIKCDLTTVPLETLYREVTRLALGTQVEAIIHLAAYKDLTESYKIPGAYYYNNLVSTMKTLELARLLGTKTFIFSSSSAVYNDELYGCVAESDPHEAPSPYGNTKLIAERIISEVCQSSGISSFCLRYCNPAGGYPWLLDRSTSMFGNILNHLEDGKFTIFGGDYPTVDGTPIRDYVDVLDIVRAHLHFIEIKLDSQVNDVMNVGSGVGTSCLEICKKVQERYPEFKYTIGSRREGDAAGSYADITKLRKWGFEPQTTLDQLIDSVLNFKDSQCSTAEFIKEMLPEL